MRALTITAALLVVLQTPQAPQPTHAQQLPVFRGGTHFVRVDAYPTDKLGKIIEGLTPDDFDITEDGKPQKVESFDFISYPTFTPDSERRDPSSQQGGFDLAADPRYRVFVILVDTDLGATAGGATDKPGLSVIRQPLIQFLDRVLGPKDLYGFLTTRNSAHDLVLGQKTASVEAQIADMWRGALIDRDADVDALRQCGPQAEGLVDRLMLDRSYTSLESLIRELGSLREERKNVIFVSNALHRPKADVAAFRRSSSPMPKAGITGGRVGIGDRSSDGLSNDRACAGDASRLLLMDFDERFRDLLQLARHENVAFYPVSPAGLQAPVTVADANIVRDQTDDLITLAHETGGVPIVNTNDLSGGMKRIADDLSAFYLLGYYTTNTTWDGGLRTIKVRLKPSGAAVRARRGYRAPTKAEIEELAAGPPPKVNAPAPPTDRESALSVLERADRPFAAYAAWTPKGLTIVTELSADSIQQARWKNGAAIKIVASNAAGDPVATADGRIEPGAFGAVVPVTIAGSAVPARVSVALDGPGEKPQDDWLNLPPRTGRLVGDPIAYRSASHVTPRPVAAFEFARNERIRIEWPILAPVDRREARILDRTGKALPVDLPIAEDTARSMLVVEAGLSAFPHGDYLFELTAGASGATERHLLAIRVK